MIQTSAASVYFHFQLITIIIMVIATSVISSPLYETFPKNKIKTIQFENDHFESTIISMIVILQCSLSQ